MSVNSIQLREITEIGKKNIIPISVLIEVCHSCNEKCTHCCLEDHVKKGLTLQQYEYLFDQLVSAGTFYVILTGGEPFMRHDFIDIVKAARKRRLSVTIFTNNTLVTEQQISTLKSLYVDEIHVSIYSSNEAIHDNITGTPGSLAKSISNIKKMINSGITIRIKCPIMNSTANEVKGIKKLAEQLGVNVQYSTVITAKNNGDMITHQHQLTQEQLRVIISDPQITSQGKKQIYFRENLDCIPCDTVYNGGAVDPEGNVFVCNQMRIVGGNILTQPFGQIWKESIAFQKLREIKLRNLKECPDCQLFQYCTRCPGLAQLEDKDILGCSSSAKKVAEARRVVGVYPTESHIFSKSSS